MQIFSPDQLVGQNVGAYRVERLLGRGRVNAVYLAYHSTQNTPVALTTFIIPENFSFEARQYFLERFRKEAARLAALRQSHILPVHDYGTYSGYPYLVTPYMTNGSLADILKRQGRLHHTEVLDILWQVVDGLAYAHGRGVFHGALKTANIVLNDQHQMLVAGFGLTHILQMRGIEQVERPYGHLFSIAGTFLTTAEYIAPEVVQDQPVDARTDVYSLGVILFELLSGKTPFTGTDPLEIVRRHVQQPVPSLRTFCPDISLALAAVVNQALDRDPARRFQRVDELAEAFAEVSATLPTNGTGATTTSIRNAALQETPPTGYSLGNWQFLPPVITDKIAAVRQPSQEINDQELTLPAYLIDSSPLFISSSSKQPVAPILPASEPVVTPPTSQDQEALYDLWELSPQEPLSPNRSGFAQWNTSPPERRLVSTRRPLPFEKSKTRRNERISRRKVIAALAAGGVAVAGMAVGINLVGNAPNQQAQNNAANLPKNAALNFMNPANGKGSVLVHLENGNFVAYDRACTHAGVFVNYDPATKLLACPAHGATFDPAKGAAVVQGPATTPLPKVTFHINAAGTITA